MKLQVKEGDLSTEILEDILDIFVRVKTSGTQLRVETKLVTALIREILYLRKETCPLCEFSIEEASQALPSERDPKAITLKPNATIKVEEFVLSESLLEKSPPLEAIKSTEETNPTEPVTGEQLPAIIEEVPKPKKPLLLRGKISRPKEKPSFRFWIIWGLILFNVSWITALIVFLF
jgi:hypothetical protein